MKARNRTGRIRVRRKWKLNPATRVKKSAKLYARHRDKKKVRRELSELL